MSLKDHVVITALAVSAGLASADEAQITSRATLIDQGHRAATALNKELDTTPSLKATSQGSLLSTTVYEGPLAGQALTIDPATDHFTITTATSQGQSTLRAKIGDKETLNPANGLTTYSLRGGLNGECTLSKLGTGASPNTLSYVFACRTNYGDGTLTIKPADNLAAYSYNIGALVKQNPKTGQTEHGFIQRRAELAFTPQ